MRLAITVALCALTAQLALADEDLRVHPWKCLDKQNPLDSGKLLEVDGIGSVLQIKHEADEPRSLTLLTIEKPPITLHAHGLRVPLRHAGFKDRAHLEMLTFFPDGRSYFTRTTAPRGPLRCIEGTSDWRTALLPFFGAEGQEAPTKIVLNLHMNGPGMLELGPVTLIQSTGAFDFRDTPDAWWGNRTAGVAGGIIGLYGAILGTLVGVLGSRGKARGLVMGLMRFTPALGVAMAALGLAALFIGQPYAVWYPPLLAGALFIALPLGLFRTVRRRYEAIELRRMESVDAG